ncbi:MAG: four helix bundle protein [Bacteroidales bacterium]|nr:four helix bundle protein [Bacteroidales bacterium]
MGSYAFENLEVWKESRQLVLMIYRIQNTFPSFEKFGLGDQIRRAAVSVSSNIVEGNARYSTKEQIHFIEIAIGSLMEVYCQLILAFDLEYITADQLSECDDKIGIILKMLKGMRCKKIKMQGKAGE